MSSQPSWRERKRRLWELLDLGGPDDTDEGHAVDNHFLQQEALHNKERMSEFNDIRFTNRDLSNFGALAHGPFGSVDMVRCKLDNKLYVRKSVEKKVVARNPSQCYPYHEKEILLAASTLNSPWAPHLLCTFQNHTNLCYVMDFAEGGSLGDLMETSGQITERDLEWWLPQMVAAIHWCHCQGFCHRDVKPANFVVTATGHLLLIDFASSARLLPPDSDGIQLVPKESCLVLCGTCDYISPEILAMQEDALVALDDQEEIFVPRGEGGYGRETDWWSLGATVYELVYGVAPFFARDIRGTYDLIINHERTLRFPNGNASASCVSFIVGLLQTPTQRLGRRSIEEIKAHSFLSAVSWTRLHSAAKPSGLQLPQFEYDLPTHSIHDDDNDESFSKGYAFSAFFNSSVSSSSADPNTTHLTFARQTSPQPPNSPAAGDIPPHLSQYIGFTWGPKIDAFDHPLQPPLTPPHLPQFQTPVPSSKQPMPRPNLHSFQSAPFSAPQQTTNQRPLSALVTPIRPSSMHGPNHPPSTIRRTAGGTARKAGTTRAVSEVEALRQMEDCVRASARKRLSQHAGRTPGPGSSGAMSSGMRRRANWVRMTLDFENVEGVHGDDDDEPPRSAHSRAAFSPVGRRGKTAGDRSTRSEEAGLRIFVKDRVSRTASSHVRRKSSGSFKGYRPPIGRQSEDYDEQSTGGILFGTVMRSDDDATTTDDAPPSPSPSPRPMSAVSRPTSSLSRRGLTPVPPFSSTSISAGGISINTSTANPNLKAVRPVSFHSISKSGSLSGLNSTPSSTKIPAEEPVAIFKPIQPNSRSTSGSSSTNLSHGASKVGARSGSLGRIFAQDGDNDVTPKAKQQPSSTRPIFVPPAPNFRENPRPQNRTEAESYQGRGQESDSGSQGHRQRNASSFHPAQRHAQENEGVPLSSELLPQSRTSNGSKFAEMEERLRFMMRDIEQVEDGLTKARTRLGP